MGNAQSLSEHVAAMPVKEVNRSTKNMLAQKLDPPHAGYNTNMVMQDWTGLAELMLLDPDEIDVFENCATANEAKTMGILKKWSFQAGSTVGKLAELITELERHDILNDDRLINRLNKDYEAYKKRKAQQRQEDDQYMQMLEEQIRPTQVPQIDSTHQDKLEQRDREFNEMDQIVVDDVRHPDKPQVIYDAFVSYCQADFEFVLEMLDTLENQHGLRLCVNARDLLPGASKHFVTANLIADRCKKVILIMSPDFVNSPECEFQVKIALSLSPGAKQRILIPILYRPCSMPLVLQHVCTVDFTKIDIADWFWMRLAASLQDSRSHVVSRQITFDESISLQKVELELLPDTDTEEKRAMVDSIQGEKDRRAQAEVTKPKFKTQPRKTFPIEPVKEEMQKIGNAPQPAPRNFPAQRNNDINVPPEVGAVNGLDRDTTQTKKSKEKKSFFGRGIGKGKKSKKSTETPVEPGYEYIENNLRYESGSDNEDLGSRPPSVSKPDPPPSEPKRGIFSKIKEITLSKTESVQIISKKNKVAKSPAKTPMINHPMFTGRTTSPPQNNFTRKTKQHKAAPVTVNLPNTRNDSTTTDSDASTLVSDTDKYLTTLNSSVKQPPNQVNRVQQQHQIGLPKTQKQDLQSNRNVQMSVQLPSNPSDLDTHDLETSMECDMGSLGKPSNRPSRGVCLPPPSAERPNHDISVQSTIVTNVSRTSSKSTGPNNADVNLYTLDSMDICLPPISASIKSNESSGEINEPVRFPPQNNAVVQPPPPPQVLLSDVTGSSRDTEGFDLESHALASLDMSEFIFKDQQIPPSLNKSRGDYSPNIQLPPAFIGHIGDDDNDDNEALEDEKMSVTDDMTFHTGSTGIRSFFPDTSSSELETSIKFAR